MGERANITGLSNKLIAIPGAGHVPVSVALPTYFAALPVSVSMRCAASVCRGCFYTALRAARLRVQQQQLINDTGADGVSYLDRALEFIIESMDLAHAECPAKSQEPTTV